MSAIDSTLEYTSLGAPLSPSQPYRRSDAQRPHWKQLAICFLLGSVLSACFFQIGPMITPASNLVVTGGGILAETTPATGLVAMPHKFSVNGTTPVELQLSRGTCWVFAAVAILEWTYRSQGVAQGWLKPKEYVRMSEQAFGISVLDACLALPQNQSCVIGDEVWRGRQLMPIDTEGGDADTLFYLQSLSTRAALPWSVCKYTPFAGHDHRCPGLEHAQQVNPLVFTMASISWLYERHAVKSRLVSSERLLSFSTPSASTAFDPSVSVIDRAVAR